MSDTISTPAVGFTGGPAAAPAAAGTGGCCGNAPQAGPGLPVSATEAGAPCCGTTADAQQSGSCCGAAAKREAVTAGQGCCG